MVFQTLRLLARSRGPDEFWRKRKIFKLSAHFRGRARNCYSLAIRAVHRALQHATLGRHLKKADLRQLWDTRTDAACEEQNILPFHLRDGLAKSDILLSRKTLSDVAAWEPRTFRMLTSIAGTKAGQDVVKKGAETKKIFINGID